MTGLLAESAVGVIRLTIRLGGDQGGRLGLDRHRLVAKLTPLLFLQETALDEVDCELSGIVTDGVQSADEVVVARWQPTEYGHGDLGVRYVGTHRLEGRRESLDAVDVGHHLLGFGHLGRVELAAGEHEVEQSVTLEDVGDRLQHFLGRSDVADVGEVVIGES